MKSIFRGLIFLCTLTSYLNLAFPVSAAGQISILSHDGWLDWFDYYHVSGEVQNVGDSAVNFVKVTATFYDSSDTVIAVNYTYTGLCVILPGRKSPFEIRLVDTSQALRVHHYTLDVTFSSTNLVPMGLEILSHNSYVLAGCMHVIGDIKNIAAGTATYVRIMATFYNSTGHVVATSYCMSDPSDLDPNQTGTIDLLLMHVSRVPLITSYALTTESDQYAVIPEFLPSSIIPLLMIATLLAVMLCNKEHLSETTLIIPDSHNHSKESLERKLRITAKCA